MAFGKISPQDSAVGGADTEEPMSAAAKVTLVKPVQDDNELSKSQARPKVGRARAIDIPAYSPVKNIDPVLSARIEWEAKGKNREDDRGAPGLSSTRPWDFRFALLLVGLFIAVNLGLMLLLHKNHGSTPHATSESALSRPAARNVPAPAMAESAPPAPVLKETVTTVPAVPAQASPSPIASAPALPPSPAASVPSVPTLPPVEAAAPVTQVAPTAAAAASAPAAPSADLLSIIGKN